MSERLADIDRRDFKKWVPTRLRAGDQLGATSSSPVAFANDLSKVYGIPPAVIAQGNGVRWTTKDINDWVVRTGGTMQPSGYAAFTSSSVIKLPNIPRVDGPPSKPSTPAVAGGLGLGLLALLGLFVLTR